MSARSHLLRGSVNTMTETHEIHEETVTDAQPKLHHGVWLGPEQFSAGMPPAMVGDSTWQEVIESVMAPGAATADQDMLLVATKEGDYWIPRCILSGVSGAFTGYSDDNIKSLMRSRDRAIEAAAQAQAETAEADPNGALVLRLSQPMAELLRDTFALAAQGREVTIMVSNPDGQ